MVCPGGWGQPVCWKGKEQLEKIISKIKLNMEKFQAKLLYSLSFIFPLTFMVRLI